MIRTLIALAGVGLLLSVAVYVSASLGVDPKTWFYLYWVLHVGLFVIWFPAVLLSNELPHRISHGKREDRIMTNLPKWMARSTIVVFFFAVANFSVMMALTHGGSVEEKNGRADLVSHDHVVKQLTSAEARDIPLYEARLFSGHWIALYWIGICALYSSVWHSGTRRADRSLRLHPRMLNSTSHSAR
jgi:hypothetical protein